MLGLGISYLSYVSATVPPLDPELAVGIATTTMDIFVLPTPTLRSFVPGSC